MYTSTLLESDSFPINEMNKAARKEKKGGAKPPIWEMVFWWTRKPLISARSIILGAVLDDSTSPETFVEIARLNAKKSPHRENPKVPAELAAKLKEMSLLDPFAGFGSIPLEAIRLGIGRVVAVELLPTAYIFLKAVLEYPKWATDNGLENQLIRDLEKWGKWVVEQLRQDKDIAELYDEDVAVYIGTWEVKCPACGRYTPLVGNWWLVRTKDRRVYMKPKVNKDKVEIEIVEGEDKPPAKNINAREEYARCLLCGTKISKAYRDDKNIVLVASESKPKDKEVEFYPKLALRDWNEKLEHYLWGAISLDELKSSLARPTLLVKVKTIARQTGRKRMKRELVFEPATQQDNEKLWRALEKLKQIWGDPDIPTEPIPEYEKRQLMVCTSTGACKWFKLFNPRQLLTLVKLVKLVREAGRRVEEEKLEQGWDKQKAHKYAEAITTYLAIALCKYADFNSMTTRWNPGWLKFEESLSVRGIAMMWSWTDAQSEGEFTGTFKRNLENTIESLRYLINAVSGSPSRVEVVLDDATVLGRLGDERFDLIVTDPPYRDDVPYAELSDFYYVWLKRVLREYHPEAFRYGTQWEWLSLQEVTYNEGRVKYFLKERGPEHYTKLLGEAFKAMNRRLKRDGLLVVYFAHTSPEAWVELIEAGWRYAGLALAKAWSVFTESEERVTARGKTALETSVVTVWRVKDGTRITMSKVVEDARKAVRKVLSTSRLKGIDLFFEAYTTALSVMTRYNDIEVVMGMYAKAEDIVAKAMEITAKEIVGEYSQKMGPASLVYALFKKIHAGERTVEMSSREVITLGYGIARGTGIKLSNLLLSERLVEPVQNASKGSRVAKQKVFRLLSPADATTDAVKEVAGRRRLDLAMLGVIKKRKVERFTNAVDILHVLEYRATQTLEEFTKTYERIREEYPELLEEAMYLAETIAKISGDPEGKLSTNVLIKVREATMYRGGL
ncbi:MAG: DUF1156 domain-containing protein [Ignisphaera sp.]